jgi:general secretion pathway protein F
MIRFWYRSVGPAGEVVEGMLDAPSRAALIEQLQDQGHVPIRAEEASAPAAYSPARAGRNSLLGRPGLPRRRLALLVRELATLLDAGLPLDRALEMMAGMAEGTVERECLTSLVDSVSSGRQLGDAMAPRERDFPPLCVSMVRAGEAAGAVSAGLLRLSECLERAEQTREHVRSALAYPVIVLAVCGISVAILFLFVIPRFRPLFEQAGTNLPVATRGVLAFSDLLRGWWWLILDRASLLAQSILEAAGTRELLTEGVEAGQTSEGVEWRTTTRRRDDLISSDPANVLVIPYEVEVEVAWRDGRTSRSLTLHTIRLGTRP